MATDTVVYQYPKCSTCKKALQWLDARGLAYTAVDIVKQPPSLAQLERLLQRSKLPVRKLFNTSGQSYRDGNFKNRLEQMTQEEALLALSQDGKLIKRPLLVKDDVVLAGFNEATWSVLDA